MVSAMQTSGRLGFGEFLSDIRYVVTSPAQRFSVILERGAMWGSILLLILPVYLAFHFAGGIYFDHDPFPGYSFLAPAVLAAVAQLMKAYAIHFFARLFEGKWHYSAGTGTFRKFLTVFGYTGVPGTLAVICATLMFLLVPQQIGMAFRDFKAITVSLFIAFGVGLFIWGLILLVLALRPVYRMRDWKIVAAFILGTVLVVVLTLANSLLAVQAQTEYVYVQPILSARVLGFLAVDPEQTHPRESKIAIHVDRLVYRLKAPERFDLIAFEPVQPGSDSTRRGAVYGKSWLIAWKQTDQTVGRIVGLPGDSVEVLQGVLRVNGRDWEEPYLAAGFRSNVTLPISHLGPSEYLVLPENRHLLESQKSGWVVDRSRILGRIVLKMWPLGWGLYSPNAFLHAYPKN